MMTCSVLECSGTEYRARWVQDSLKFPRSLMLSPPDSVAILQLLLKLTCAKVAVEVGTFTGNLLLCMVLACSKLVDSEYAA